MRKIFFGVFLTLQNVAVTIVVVYVKAQAIKSSIHSIWQHVYCTILSLLHLLCFVLKMPFLSIKTVRAGWT